MFYGSLSSYRATSQQENPRPLGRDFLRVTPSKLVSLPTAADLADFAVATDNNCEPPHHDRVVIVVRAMRAPTVLIVAVADADTHRTGADVDTLRIGWQRKRNACGRQESLQVSASGASLFLSHVW
jgi:hypothetical protein